MKFSEHKENRLAKMRLGQSACEITELPSAPDTRVALVPLTDSEYIRALEVADKAPVGDNPAGFAVRDELQKQSVIYFSAREFGDLESMFFDDLSEAGELDTHDIDFLYDVYLEMISNQSPSLFGLTDDDFEALKKVWTMIEWNALTGQQWYAAQRFINSIRTELHLASYSGSSSTSNLTQTNESGSPAASAR
jgi:hypothetical protein